MRQRSERTLAWLLVLALLCALPAAGVFAQPAPDQPVEPVEEPIDPATPPSTAVNPPEAMIQQAASEAAQAIMETFETTPGGNTVYPDDFAGMWLEDDLLVISLTTDDPAVQAHYADLSGNAEVLRFVRADIPLNTLSAYQDVGGRLARDAGLRFYGSYPSQQDNVVVLEVEAEDIPAVWDVLHKQITPATFWGTGTPLLSIDRVFRVVPGEPSFPD